MFVFTFPTVNGTLKPAQDHGRCLFADRNLTRNSWTRQTLERRVNLDKRTRKYRQSCMVCPHTEATRYRASPVSIKPLLRWRRISGQHDKHKDDRSGAVPTQPRPRPWALCTSGDEGAVGVARLYSRVCRVGFGGEHEAAGERRAYSQASHRGLPTSVQA